ncbi:MAG: DUF4296 domain-containing protein [Bacteroidia bacterium]|nr:DUF4296 domain-containing protein [Bacteroidia bacterium]NND11246.1 DUF4296 domain-containing protein [Flavobacteriaceae bacterium]MBT8309741.1 DUF4296 domain-containing protein [Bacteroidia bacterium]NNK27355.1 DUF4296 domain-containing protein [Flavobacteriaceae bacterium]NNL60332.1 DUF4296 domain-containing protein [Flavobacteriaceae bacterium]
MRKLLGTIVTIAFLFSCGNGKVKKPEDLIAQSKMVDIIVDLNMMSSGQGLNKSVLLKEGIVPEEYVYKKYDIDSAQFIASNKYYAHHIEIYQDIYDNVKKKLNEKKAEYKKISEEEKEEKKIQDSIRRQKKRLQKQSIVNPKSNKELKPIKRPVKITDTLRQ